MKKSNFVKIGLVALLAASVVGCQQGDVTGSNAVATGGAASTNIAFLDGSQIVQQYEPQIETALKAEFEAQQKSLMQMQEQLIKESEDYKRDSAILSAEEKAKKQTAFEEKQREFMRLSNNFNEQKTLRSNQELQTLLDAVKEVVEKIAVENGYDVVLQRGAAVYANEKYDITSKVMDSLKDKKLEF